MSGRQKGDKLEPKLALDMDFAEALERFVQTKPKEVEESIERSKQKRPPGNDSPRRPARSTEHVASPSSRDRKHSGD